MNLKRLKTFFFFSFAKLPISRRKRCFLIKWAGVNCANNKILIGSGCEFDSLCPQNIHLGKNVHLTNRVVILTHYLVTSQQGINWRYGHVYIGDNTFVGTGTIISKDVRIGKNCIIGAGSVVTKDIPDNEIWAGNPARFIKKRWLIRHFE